MPRYRGFTFVSIHLFGCAYISYQVYFDVNVKNVVKLQRKPSCSARAAKFLVKDPHCKH